jgi:hypothetical protein
LHRHGPFAAMPAGKKPCGSTIRSRVVAVICWAHALAGCAAGLAAPPVHQIARSPTASALMTAPMKPDCTFHDIGLGDTLPDPAEAALRKLDYERGCYRRAEMQVRARLRRLQASVAAGMKTTAGVPIPKFAQPRSTF